MTACIESTENVIFRDSAVKKKKALELSDSINEQDNNNLTVSSN